MAERKPFSKEEIEELKKLGVRDISEIDLSKVVNSITNSKQVQETIKKIQEEAKVVNVEEEIRKHIVSLAKMSNRKLSDIVNKVTIEQIKAYLKVRFKLNVDENEIKMYMDRIKNSIEENEHE